MISLRYFNIILNLLNFSINFIYNKIRKIYGINQDENDKMRYELNLNTNFTRKIALIDH